MPRKLVDPILAVAMHKRGRKVCEIAAAFGTQKPCIYRAFRKAGYESPGMAKRRLELAKREPKPKFPPTWPRQYQTERLGHIVRNCKTAQDNIPPPIEPRDPCPRCGCRGDIGCKHSQVRLGWSVG